MRRRLAAEDGQALLLTTVFLVVLIGAVALTIDFGAWYRQQRQAQAVADAAALAGAQALPADPAGALALVQKYAASNGGDVAPADVAFRSDYQPDDTVAVRATRTSPSFFSRLFSVGDVTVHASAAARAAVPDQVYGAAPIVVNKLHPLLSGPGCPCFRTETTVPLDPNGAPGAFGFANLDPAASNGVPPLAQWIHAGFAGYLPLGSYDSDPGAKFNASGIPAALGTRIGTQLLLPVYDLLQGGGSVATYRVIGWVAFHLDCYGLATSSTDCSQPHGNHASLTGYFTSVIWDGLQSSTNLHLPDFGLYSVSLVN